MLDSPKLAPDDKSRPGGCCRTYKNSQDCDACRRSRSRENRSDSSPDASNKSRFIKSGGDALFDSMLNSLKGNYRLAQGYAMGVNNDLINGNPEGVEYISYPYVVMTENYYSPSGNQIFDVRNTQGVTLGYYMFLLRRNFLGPSIIIPLTSGIKYKVNPIGNYQLDY